MNLKNNPNNYFGVKTKRLWQQGKHCLYQFQTETIKYKLTCLNALHNIVSTSESHNAVKVLNLAQNCCYLLALDCKRTKK